MPFIGNKPSAVPLTSADIADSIITSAKIVDGTIVNADISATAAIAGSKLSGAGFSGATINTVSAVDITLTSASTQVQNIAMTVAGNSVILPDATTLTTKGSQVFVINNAGGFDFYIENNSGFVISKVTLGASQQLALTDNSTAAGKWSQEDYNLTLACSPVATSTGNPSNGSFLYSPQLNGVSISKISATSALATYHKGTNQRDIYGVVVSYSGTTVTVNSETLLYSGTTTAGQNSQSCLLNSTTGLLIVNRSGNNVAVPFTISGTTITAGTTSSTFGVGPTVEGYSQTGKPIAMSSTIALIVERNSTSNATWVFKTITHNGASAPTIGTASSSITNINYSIAPEMVAIDSTNAFVCYPAATTGYNVARVVTINGSSAPTLQTANTTSTTVLSVSYMGNIPVKISSTEFIAVGGSASINYTLSGTTVTYVGVQVYQFGNVINPNDNAGDVLLGTAGDSNYWWYYSKFGSYYLPRTYYFYSIFPFEPYTSINVQANAYVGLDSNTWFMAKASSASVLQFAILKYIGS